MTGNKQGRTLGFPTLNLNVTAVPKDQRQGVFAALVKYEKKFYKAALFFGPRIVLGETQPVLEIHILDFSGSLYNKIISFQIHDFIREVKNFSRLNEMKKQIENDVKKIRALTF
ncbi:MAG: riboflavin kinase [Candidatus Levybacteria bacterium]|nr:riboflavin kinase [Candidatus Levybacteria bacterium]